MRPSTLNQRRPERRPDRGSPRPFAPAKKRRTAGPALFAPLLPAEHWRRREMRRAALYRLARLAHVRPADLPTDPARLLEMVAGLSRFGDRGRARRLAEKVIRLGR